MLYPSYLSSFSEMDDAKRRAAIRLQAAKNKEAGVDTMGTGSSKPSIKRELPSKGDRAPKKPKVPLEPVVGLMVEGVKMVTLAKHGVGNGLMIAPPGSQKKHPSYSVKTPNMPWKGSHPLSLLMIMKTWATIRRRPWGRWVFLALPR